MGLNIAERVIVATNKGVPADFYATGIGDDAAISQAINSLVAAGGGKVTLENGIYNITQPILLTALVNIEIEGLGTGATVLKLGNGINKDVFQITGSTQRIKIRSLTIDGNSSNNTKGNGIYIQVASGSGDADHMFENLIIQNCANDGFKIDTPVPQGSWYFLKVHTTNNGGNGFNLVYPGLTDSVFDQCIADTNALNGFYIGGFDCQYIGCKAFYNGSQAAGHGWRIVGYNNYFTNCEAQDNYGSGFYSQNEGDATYGSQDCVFVNCAADSNNQALNPAYGVGFQLINVQNWMLVNCQAFVRPYPSFTQRLGVSLEKNAANNRIVNLQGTGNSQALYSDTSTGTGNFPLHISGLQSEHSDAFDVQNNLYFKYGNYLGVSPGSNWPNGTHKLVEVDFDGSNDEVNFYAPGNNTNTQKIFSLGSDRSIGFYGHQRSKVQVLATGVSHTVDDVIAALQAVGLVYQTTTSTSTSSTSTSTSTTTTSTSTSSSTSTSTTTTL